MGNKTKIRKRKLKEYFLMEEVKPEISKETKVKLSSIARAYNKINETLNGVYQDFGSVEKLVEALIKEATGKMINEDDDWFDKVTIKRNQTDLNKRGGDFLKAFKEVKDSSLRLQALHEEIGFILNRYFSLGENNNEERE